MRRTMWNNPARIPVDVDPLPILAPPEWMADGICAQVGGHGWDSLSIEGQVEFCQPCPVIEVCGTFGVEQLMCLNRTATTVYGGLTPDQIVDEARVRKVVA